MSEGSEASRFPREFPGVHWYDNAEEDAALRVIRSHSPFRYYGAGTLGEADALERDFAALLGRRYAQAVSSCTNGLAASMAAMAIGPGHEVLVPGFMWVATISAIVRAGAIPVLVEIDDSYNMDPADLARKITPRSRLVVPVHMCGVPCDMPAILEIARRHGLYVLEDCAQANGASRFGRAAGTFGDMAAFSFQANKNITAGEGGMVVTDDEKLYLRLNAAHDVGSPWAKGLPAQESEHALWGFGARMSEVAAAIVRVQLKKLDTIVAHMRTSKYRLLDALAGLKGLSWQRVDDPAGDSGPFVIVRFGSPAVAAAFANQCHARKLIATHLPEYGLHVYYNIRALVDHCSNSHDGFPWTHPANAGLVREYGRGSLPRTDELLEHSVVLPVPSILTPEQEDEYVAMLREAYKAAGGES